jgi:hypothetical protein
VNLPVQGVPEIVKARHTDIRGVDMLVALTVMRELSTVLICSKRTLNLHLGTSLMVVVLVQKAVEYYVVTAYTSVADSSHTLSEKWEVHQTH